MYCGNKMWSSRADNILLKPWWKYSEYTLTTAAFAVVVVVMKRFTVLLFSKDSLSVLWALSSMITGEQWQTSTPGSESFRLWAWTKVRMSIMTSECNCWNPCLYNLDQKCMKVLKNWILIWANKSMLLRGFMVTVKKKTDNLSIHSALM